MFPLLAALLLPPAPDSARWVVMNHGRPAGDLVVMSSRDSVVSRFVFRDRNRGTRVETRYRYGTNGTIVAGESRPVLPDGTLGQVGDRFQVIGDSIIYGTTRAAVRTGSWIALRNGTPWDEAGLAKFLLTQPGRAASIAPSGRARAEVIADTVLRHGAQRQRARLVMIYRGTSTTPNGVWLDETGALLSTDAQWFITVRESAIPLMDALRAIELKWRNAQGEAISAKVRLKTTGLVVFRNGDVFDSETGTMRPRQTVIVQGDRILRMGPADSVPIPADVSVFDITGKTLMPGMWEMHTHVQVSNQSFGSILQLAQGLTTSRDMAADLDVAVSQRDREREGKLASPRMVLAGFLEGPLAWAGPTAAIASNEAEARAWVARYDSLGYRQVKLYNVLHPDLVPVIAAEARKRGMRLSGHIPRGMSVRAAVALGFDEINHAAFLFSDFYPDSLYLPQMRAYSAVATAVAPRIDVNGPGMTSLINFLAERGTVIDGTFNLWIGGGASVVGAGGSTDQQRADSAYLRLIRRLYDAGVPLTAGTDNLTGTTYRRELEMYELAGIPASRVLQIATIDAARIMKDDKDYGSLAPGKVADMIVVNGRPAERIGDLARVETVVRGGRVYRVTDLLQAVGSSVAQ